MTAGRVIDLFAWDLLGSNTENLCLGNRSILVKPGWLGLPIAGIIVLWDVRFIEFLQDWDMQLWAQSQKNKTSNWSECLNAHHSLCPGEPLLFCFSLFSRPLFKIVSQSERSLYSIFIYLSFMCLGFWGFSNLRRKK